MSENPPGIVPSDSPPPGIYDVICHAIEEHSRSLTGPAHPRLLVIPIRDDAGAVAGGLWGSTLFQWLNVQLLFIPEPLRNKGVGSALMTMAEVEARKRGCVGSHLITFSFQAGPFYEKLGYTRFGVLEDYPIGHSLLHFRKRLAGSSAGMMSCADSPIVP